MKKFLLTIAVFATTLVASAQTMRIHFKNGTKVEFNSENVDFVDFAEKPADPTLTAGDYVDLGLPSGTLWATCNLGATKPTEFGSRYAWGETTSKSTFSTSNYAYYNSSTDSYTDIGTDISGTGYDAATVNLGKDWRMPSKTEMAELYSKCTWQWTQVDGVNGYMVTGPNGNSLFFPHNAIFLSYTPFWTSSNNGSSNGSAAVWAYFTSSSNSWMDATSGIPRYYGFYIRPVYSPSQPDGIENITDYVTVSRTGNSTSIINGSAKYGVSFSIKNSSTETIHLTSLAGVAINKDLKAGETYSISLEGTTSYIQNYKQELLFTYNGKSYSVKG
jgi:hypothetical protein